MNWFKKLAIDWGQNPFYHLLNTLKFQVEQFPGMHFSPVSAKLDTSGDRATFYIDTDYSAQYQIALRRRPDRLEVTIITDNHGYVANLAFNFKGSQPYEVSNEILAAIDNHINRYIK